MLTSCALFSELQIYQCLVAHSCCRVCDLELLANAQQVMEEEQKSQSRLSRLNSSSFRRKGSTGKQALVGSRQINRIK